VEGMSMICEISVAVICCAAIVVTICILTGCRINSALDVIKSSLTLFPLLVIIPIVKIFLFLAKYPLLVKL
jgi:hypothetical protein